jgi:hypothetical protein
MNISGQDVSMLSDLHLNSTARPAKRCRQFDCTRSDSRSQTAKHTDWPTSQDARSMTTRLEEELIRQPLMHRCDGDGSISRPPKEVKGG